MRILVIFLAAVTGLVVLDAAAQRSVARIAGNCMCCHGGPDPGAPGEKLWINRIRTTACVQPPAPKGKRQRDALIRYFLKNAKRPQRVDRELKPREGQGRVVSNVGHGSILLVPAGVHHEHVEKGFRLVWPDAQAGKARMVPAGDYVVRGYRVLKKDTKGTTWQLWGSGAKGRRVRVVAGKTVNIKLDLRVHVRARAVPRGDKLQVGVGVTGDSHMGVTVVRNKDRVDATYKILGKRKALATGSMKYG